MSEPQHQNCSPLLSCVGSRDNGLVVGEEEAANNGKELKLRTQRRRHETIRHITSYAHVPFPSFRISSSVTSRHSPICDPGRRT